MRWALVFLWAVIGSVYTQETCRSVEDDAYQLFGTKTAYIFANKGIPLERIHEVPGCQPIAFWLMNRHGSHNPEEFEFTDLQRLVDFKENIINNYRNGNYRNTNQRMCASDINLLELWQWNSRLNISFAGDLTSDGYISTQQLAQAWRQRYPGLLTDNRHDYAFKLVNDKRSITTFRAFIEGLFKVQAEGIDIPRENNEHLLKPYQSCKAWINNVEGNNNTLAQYYIFESKREFKEMISRISLRLGFNYDLDVKFILNMYDMCRYNKAWNVATISPWCSVFTKDDLKQLEYSEDLATYYKYGYGTQINQKLGCLPIKDMMQFFHRHVDNALPQQPRSIINFVESPMLLMTLAAMSSHKDFVPLTGDNYRSDFIRNRKWTSSTMSPFNGNLAAILYKCNPNGKTQFKDQYQVLFLENEQQMYLDGCRVGLCDWSYVKERFGNLVQTCDLGFCDGAINLNGFYTLLTALAVLFIKVQEFDMKIFI